MLGDQRINSFGIGGEVEIRTGLHVQRMLISSPIVHVGLGEATRAEVARIFWPNGTIQSEFGLTADATVAASQRLKGSCPWLFAWNGREMAFVTDLIWRSPLGLRINAQATADIQATEDWVKVRGDQLVARDGAYDLRVTAELWETHFFDRLALGYVDHPAGTEVFVDERFAVPAPPLDLVATDPVRAFASVRDDRGHDVADVVAARDDRHLDFAGRGAYQGITRDHFVELELPEDAPRDGPLWLIGQGWVHPTDSSVNVAISQGAHAAPRSLSLQVADSSGTLPSGAGRAWLPVGQGQDRPHRPGGRLSADRAQAPAARDESRSVLGPAGLGRGPTGGATADGPAAASCGRLALPWVLGDRTTRRQHSRAAALPRWPARRRAGPISRAITRGLATWCPW